MSGSGLHEALICPEGSPRCASMTPAGALRSPAEATVCRVPCPESMRKFPYRPRSAGASGERLEIACDRLHLRRAQVLRDTMHHRDVAHVALERAELLQNVFRVLSRETWIHVVAQRIRTVAGGACRHSLRSYAMLEDVASARDSRGVVTLPGACRLPGIVVRQRSERLVRKPAGHAPHVRDRVRVAAGLVLEGLQLALEVTGVLPGETGKHGVGAVSVGAVARSADADGHI